MPRRLHAPGCVLAVLSLAAPHAAYGQPAPDDAQAAPTEPDASEAPAGDAPEADSASAPREPTAEQPEPAAAAEEASVEGDDRADPQTGDDEASVDGEASDDLADDDLDDDLDDDDGDDDLADDDESAASVVSPLPDRLPRLQRIGWYHVLGAFTLGTTAGLLAGLAERQEDKATRIASGYDLETGGAVLYADRQEAYENSLDRGQALETSAIVVGALAGATAIAAITLFAVDAKRRRPSATARRTRIGPGSLEVSF